MVVNTKLVITDLTWNADNQPKPGTPITFSVTVKNEGPEDIPHARRQNTVIVYVDREPLKQMKYVGALAVGESHVFESVVWEATPGNHVITATVDFAVPSPTTVLSGETLTKHMRVADEALEVPAPAAAVGMNTLTFSDDFTTMDTIDINGTGKIGYKWYVTLPFEAPDTKPEDLEFTPDGLLLKKSDIHFNYTLGTMDMVTGAGWGYTHGYVEAKFRVPEHRYSDEVNPHHHPSIWALPYENMWSKTDEHLELDHLEYWGYIFGGEETLYTVSMHHHKYNFNVDKPGTSLEMNAVNRKTSHHFGMGDEQWHTMGWLWEEGYLTSYLDGKEIMTQKWSKDGKPDPAPEMKLGDDETGVFSVLDEHYLPMIISGGSNFPLEIAYLNVWEKK